MSEIVLNNKSASPIALSLKTLSRHFACFGSSGSGKTVACKVLIEELALQGIPVIAFDPQGDISSLALIADDNKKDIDSNDKIKFRDNVEVVIWTPSSNKGIPITINPFQFDYTQNNNEEDERRFFAGVSKNITSLIGYDLDSDNGKSCESILCIVFEYLSRNKIVLKDLSDLSKTINALSDDTLETIKSISTQKFLNEIIKKINLIMLGPRKFLFKSGVPADIKSLLGHDSNKTRISVIYLNTLASSEEKEFFVGSIAQLLYDWMIKNPMNSDSNPIQCAFFIDEISPYIPPVKKPACKSSLELLFRQGRKYGVSCLIATQSPGDIDYKSIGQFSTFALGSLNTNQDIRKVRNRLESSAPSEINNIINLLPSLNPGEFLLVSPDEYDKVQKFKVRWLLTQHPLVVTENKIDVINPKKIKDFYFSNNLSNNKKTKLTTTNNSILKNKQSSDDSVLVVENIILERNILKKLKPFLGGLFFKSHKVEEINFKFYPLIQVDLFFLKEKGFFKKNIEEIPEKLYLDYKSNKMIYIKNNQFHFVNVVDAEPHKIIDLDNKCILLEKKYSEIKFDKRIFGGKKLDKVEVKNKMERKYKVKVLSSRVLLLPFWECILSDKKNKNLKSINLDGVFGSELKFN